MKNYREAASVFQRATGQLPPGLPFPAIITGYALPQFPVDDRISPSVPIQSPIPGGCADPQAADSPISAPDQNGFYPPEFLPCGVSRVRYRFRGVNIAISSEGYGLRRTLDGKFKAWRQALYAVNVFDSLADPKLDYPLLPLGTNVIVAWGPIGLICQTPDYPDIEAPAPGFGFYFSHPVDPAGTWRCPSEDNIPVEAEGCCQLYSAQTGIFIQEFCATQVFCASFQNNQTLNPVYLGDGADCIFGPGGFQDCIDGSGPGSTDCEPAGPTGYRGGEFTPSYRLVSRTHKLGGCFDGIPSEGTPLIPPNGETCL